MEKVGFADLPLHGGTTPRWLFTRMVALSEGIVTTLIDEHGPEEFLRRISDPFWFQALSCVIGFDWHSSGTTTVTCGALKLALQNGQYGVLLAGGKGKISRRAQEELAQIGDGFNLNSASVEKLQYASKMSAKVDTVALQDGHQLYHHVIIVTENGRWAVIQQGMAPEHGYARRYHWLGEHVADFVVEPHSAILGDKRMDRTLDMTAFSSAETRLVSVDLVNEGERRINGLVRVVKDTTQSTLDKWIRTEVKRLVMPENINWKAIRAAYEFQPENYEQLIGIKGMGPGTVRALALISELIYGKPPSWRDPIKYSFAVGGKDGVPFSVNKKVMDDSIAFLKQGIEEAKLDKKEKLYALQRLRCFIPNDFK